MKPDRRTITIPTHPGGPGNPLVTRVVEADCYGWVAVHKHLGILFKTRPFPLARNNWTVSDADSGGYVADFRLVAEAKSFALDVAQTFSNPELLCDNLDAFGQLCGRHGLELVRR